MSLPLLTALAYGSARCRDVGGKRGAVDALVAAVRDSLGQLGRYRLPDPGLASTLNSPADCVPVSILGRDVAPRCAAAKPPENAIDGESVLFGRSTPAPVSGAAREQIPQNAPFRFTKIASVQPRLQKGPLNQPLSFASINLSTPPKPPKTLRLTQISKNSAVALHIEKICFYIHFLW